LLKMPDPTLNRLCIMTEKRPYDLMNRGVALQGRLRGFTLIELMVGIAIVSMVMLFVIPGMGTWIQSSRIRNGAEALQNGLQLARAEAVSRNTSVQFVLPSLASGGTGVDWIVSCVNLIPNANCPGPATSMTASAGTYIQKMSSREGAAVAELTTSPGGQSTIVFNGLGRVSSMPAGSTLTLSISNSNGGTCVKDGGTMRCLNIVLTPSGQVRMCDPAFPTGTNPRAC
jgi:type IV fimbrial biogenesis protein FimT